MVTLSATAPPGVAEAGLARGGIAPLVERTPVQRVDPGLEARPRGLPVGGRHLRRRPGPDGAGRRARLGRARRAAGRADRRLVPAQRADATRAVYEPPHVTGRRPGRRRRRAARAARAVTVEIDTPARPGAGAPSPTAARAGTLVLGHGAGGGVESADLSAVTAEAAGGRLAGAAGRAAVAGGRASGSRRRRRGSTRAGRRCWTGCAPTACSPAPLVLGGRSAGARVACRTAAAQGAAGVLALAFPLHPPGRPEKSRARGAHRRSTVPICVVQGETDALGAPDDVAAVLTGRPNASVYAVPGDHALKKDADVVAAAAASWLAELY